MTDKTTNTADFGDRVRLARHARDLSQRELGEATGMDETYISHMEAGRRDNVTVSTLVKLKTALNVSTDWLLYGIGEGP